MFNKLKLSAKLATAIGGILTVIFAILILVTTSAAKKAISNTTFGQLTVLSRSNAIEIQNIFDAAKTVSVDMGNYYERMYNANISDNISFIFHVLF